MKKLLTLFLLTVLSVQAFAQISLSLSGDTSVATGNLSDFFVNGSAAPLPVAITITNNSSKTDTVKWQRSVNSLPKGWHTSVCDFTTCYDTGKGSGLFYFDGNSSGQMNIDFLPVSVGTGISTLNIVDANNSNNHVTATFIAEVSEANGIATVTRVKSIYLSPVPVKQTLTVAYDKSLHPTKIELYNVLGQMIKSVKIVNDVNTSSTQVNLSSLDKGLYFLRLYTSDNDVLTRQFSKD